VEKYSRSAEVRPEAPETRWTGGEWATRKAGWREVMEERRTVHVQVKTSWMRWNQRSLLRVFSAFFAAFFSASDSSTC
jgi:hypothetical protein